MKGFIIVNEKDNVATALQNFQKGQNIAGVILQEDIQSGHKFALKDINTKELVIKYAEAIAIASCDIKAGTWVHVHNTEGIRGRGDEQ
ncbi:altronate hydrolase [Campylobacter insulaenigrae]|uniref:UxaA family hydrolase n=1 Tax=Campylobacter insulaenigrae TaxID=260714 RepID=UPI000F718D21|nr:UxaA family hydrolase [Campylobacter insulaenigrae]MCR6591565.1 UxaA family hydrolase [Campylobacter insulaenigrae]MCR6592365.1 UxaA family hydrolase [Campylobacter insulaenigrae]VEJ52356.1 altronate hydrolase [Campylobacter insulaenigrae]